jgi:hypothetical protein
MAASVRTRLHLLEAGGEMKDSVESETLGDAEEQARRRRVEECLKRSSTLSFVTNR